MQMQRLQASQRVSGNVSALRVKAFVPAPAQRGSLQVTAAISRQKKKEIVISLKDKFDSSLVVFGMTFKGVDVPTFQKLRRAMPEGTSIMICKNSLMRVALQDKADWGVLADKDLGGDNAWVFVPEEGLQASVKSFFEFEANLLKEAKKMAPKGTEAKNPVEVTAVCFEGKYLTAEELKKVSDLPTKLELLATIAALAKQPATKIASGIKAVPTKLARALMLVSELDEDKSVTVASVIKA